MAWPYGITDPNLYAYIMNAAASMSAYSHGLPAGGAASPSPAHLNYYASLGLQRAAAQYGPYGMPSPLRPHGDIPLPGAPHAGLLRPPVDLPPHPAVTPPSGGHVGGLSPPATHPSPSHPRESAPVSSAHPLLSHSSPILPPAGYPYHPGLPTLPLTSLHAASASLPVSSSSRVPPAIPPSLFRPYKTEVERA